jgi:hypothetical protein
MAPRLNHHASCNAEALEAKGGTAHEVSSGRRRRELRARFSFKSPLARVVSVNESKKEASTCLEAARSPLFAVPRPNQRLINSCGALKSREKKGKGKRRKAGEKPKKRKAPPLLLVFFSFWVLLERSGSANTRRTPEEHQKKPPPCRCYLEGRRFSFLRLIFGFSIFLYFS